MREITPIINIKCVPLIEYASVSDDYFQIDGGVVGCTIGAVSVAAVVVVVGIDGFLN